MTKCLPLLLFSLLVFQGLSQTSEPETKLQEINRLLEYSRFVEAERQSSILLKKDQLSEAFYIRVRFNLTESVERQGRREQAALHLDTLAQQIKNDSLLYHDFSARLLRHQGRLNRLNGNLSVADLLLQQALQLYRVKNPFSAESAICLNELGTLALRRGELTDAMQLYRQALTGFKKQNPIVNRNIAVVLNHIGLIHMRLGNQDSTDFYFDAALLKLIEKYGELHYNTALVYGNMGIVADMRGQHSEAAAFCQKALSILQKTVGENHPLNGSILNTLGVVYKNFADYDKALFYYQKALKHRQHHYPERHYRISQSYQNIGTVLLLSGDYQLAREYYARALDINRILLDSSSVQLAWNYKDLGRSEHHIGNPEQALEYYQKALIIYRQAYGHEEHGDIAVVYKNIGNIYLDLSKPQLARNTFERDLQIQNAIGRQKHPNIAASFSGIASTYLAEQNIPAAHKHLAQALAHYRQFYPEKHPAIIRCLLLQTEILTADKKPDQALKICRKILQVSDAVSGGELVFRSYLQKARIFTQKLDNGGSGKSIAVADSAIAAYQQAILNLNNMRSQFYHHRSKLIWGAKWDMIYVEALSLLIRRRDLWNQVDTNQLAFSFLESGTASVLQDIVWDLQAKHVAGVPDSLLEKERLLGGKIATIQNRLNQYLGDPQNNSAQMAAIRQELLQYRQQHGVFIDMLEERFPKYYQLKYHPGKITLEQLQKTLMDDEVLLHYASYGQKLCLLAVSSDSSRFFWMEHNTSFSAEVDTFLTKLKRLSHWPDWQNASAKLHNLLITPVASFLQGKKRLIIVSGSKLTQIPFETLIGSKNPGENGVPDYLLQHFDVQYHYSASLFAQVRQQSPSKTKRGFAGFAPVFGETLAEKTSTIESNPWPVMIKTALKTVLRSDIQALPDSRREVEDIQSLFNKVSIKNDVFLYHHASKKHFLEIAGQYQFLHLATHSLWQANQPGRSGIYFAEASDSSNRENGILYANEVYRLRLSSKLTVLSSCESGDGEYVRGEGVMAISRGFFYAGAQNLLVSLWKIPDKNTRRLMIAFYQYYLSGETLSSALRRAKLKAISRPESVHPVNWSGFILFGSS